jgi:hypothetical protein
MKKHNPIPKPIKELRKRVELWRKNRACKGPMPETLWNEAAGLAHEHGIYAVSKGAQIAYEGVKKRFNPDAPDAPKGVSAAQSLPGQFVELPMGWMSRGQGSEACAAVVELHEGRGRSLSIRVMPQALSQLPELAKMLWGLS